MTTEQERDVLQLTALLHSEEMLEIFNSCCMMHYIIFLEIKLYYKSSRWTNTYIAYIATNVQICCLAMLHHFAKTR